MNRQDFLQLFGLGAASLLASACLGGCNAATGGDSAAVPAAATNVAITVDLTATTSTPLNDAAVGYIYADSRAIIVAKPRPGPTWPSRHRVRTRAPACISARRKATLSAPTTMPFST